MPHSSHVHCGFCRPTGEQGNPSLHNGLLLKAPEQGMRKKVSIQGPPSVGVGWCQLTVLSSRDHRTCGVLDFPIWSFLNLLISAILQRGPPALCTVPSACREMCRAGGEGGWDSALSASLLSLQALAGYSIKKPFAFCAGRSPHWPPAASCSCDVGHGCKTTVQIVGYVAQLGSP